MFATAATRTTALSASLGTPRTTRSGLEAQPFGVCEHSWGCWNLVVAFGLLADDVANDDDYDDDDGPGNDGPFRTIVVVVVSFLGLC